MDELVRFVVKNIFMPKKNKIEFISWSGKNNDYFDKLKFIISLHQKGLIHDELKSKLISREIVNNLESQFEGYDFEDELEYDGSYDK